MCLIYDQLLDACACCDSMQLNLALTLSAMVEDEPDATSTENVSRLDRVVGIFKDLVAQLHDATDPRATRIRASAEYNLNLIAAQQEALRQPDEQVAV
jgi:hypothetical protein